MRSTACVCGARYLSSPVITKPRCPVSASFANESKLDNDKRTCCVCSASSTLLHRVRTFVYDTAPIARKAIKTAPRPAITAIPTVGRNGGRELDRSNVLMVSIQNESFPMSVDQFSSIRRGRPDSAPSAVTREPSWSYFDQSPARGGHDRWLILGRRPN